MSLLIKLIVMLGFTYGVITIVPSIAKMNDCYDASRKQSDTIGYNTGARGWDQKQICTEKYEAISSFEACLHEVVLTQKIHTMVVPYVHKIVQTIRPFDLSLEERKKVQDSECSEFPKTIFRVGENQ